MDPKEMLSKEIATKVRGHISQKSISEKIEQFFKQGNAFLLLEILDLRNEVKSLKKELKHQRNKKTNSISKLFVQ
jgi:hypothetical protein